MKTFSKIAVGVAAAITSLGAAAGTFEGVTSQAIGVEASTTGQKTATIPKNTITLKANSTIASGDRIFVTLDNGAGFNDTTYTLAASATSAAIGSLENYTKGNALLEFKVTSAINEIGREFVLSGSSVANQPLTVLAASKVAGQKVNVDAYNRDGFGPYDAYTAAEILRYANQFSAAVDTVADGIIDVNAARLKFVGGAAYDEVVVNLVDAGTANGVSLNDKDSLIVTLAGDMTGLGDILALTSDGYTRGTATVVNGTSGTATFAFDGSDLANSAGSAIFRIAGATSVPLTTREFSVSASLDFESETDKTLIAAGSTAGKAGEWTINGLQAKVSQLSLAAPGFISWLKVANTGTIAVDVIADIIWTTPADGVEGEVKGVMLGTIDAGGVGTISEAKILQAMGNVTQLADVHLSVTITGPSNSVHLIAEKKAADGRTTIPVFYDNATNNRNWFQ